MKLKFFYLTTSILFIFHLTAQPINLHPQEWVSDFAFVIDEQTKQQIEKIITELEQKTSAEIAVVSIETTGDYTIEEFATRLFEKWGIGKKGKDNGVLLVASIKDKKVRIEVGYGLEGILPDGLCGEILDKYVIPYFKAGDYSKGFLYGTAAIAKVIAKDAGAELTGEIYQDIKLKKEIGLLEVLVQILFLIIFFIIIFRYPFLVFWLLGSGGFSGGFGRGGFGGGFGGFGGGLSGGGGTSRSW